MSDAFRRLFRVQTPAPPGGRGAHPTRALEDESATASPSQSGAPTNVFVTPQTIVSFPVASSVLVAAWHLGNKLELTTHTSYVVPVTLAFLWAAFLLYLDITDPTRNASLRGRDYATKLVVAAANGLFLAASALGINTAIQTPEAKQSAAVGIQQNQNHGAISPSGSSAPGESKVVASNSVARPAVPDMRLDSEH